MISQQAKVILSVIAVMGSSKALAADRTNPKPKPSLPNIGDLDRLLN
ncbi:hypothetical protein L4D79_08225 [Photobacterium satsumensis]